MNSLTDLGTTGLVAYVKAGQNGRARNIRRIHAERVLSARYPTSKSLVVARFRDACCAR